MALLLIRGETIARVSFDSRSQFIPRNDETLGNARLYHHDVNRFHLIVNYFSRLGISNDSYFNIRILFKFPLFTSRADDYQREI